MRSSPVLVVVLFLLPHLAHGQTGTIAGQALDASGAVLPGVTVTVKSPALIEKERVSITDEHGRYQITALPVGMYRVEFKLETFTSVVRGNIDVTSDFTANVGAEMGVGLKATVNVVTEPPVVDVHNARVQQVFHGSEVAALPTTRDVAGVPNFVPSMVSPQRGTCNGGIGVLCNPTVPNHNSHVAPVDFEGGGNQGRVLVDGMVINAGRSNLDHGAANGITLDTASVHEVSFTMSGSLGESETGGASINIVPRTGGNRFAGSLFTSYLETKFFDRNRGTRLSETPDIQEYNHDYDVNGSFGGPILKDRLWFHVYAGNRGVDLYPAGGSAPGFANLNEGRFAANYMPDRSNGWLTYRNEYKKANVRLTWQASAKNKLNVYWDEQSSCTNPCYGMINVNASPEAWWSNQSYPTRLTQLSWTNPFTNRLLFEAGVTYVSAHEDTTQHREFTNYRSIPRVCEHGATVGRDGLAIKTPATVVADAGGGACNFGAMHSGSLNTSFASIQDPMLQSIVRNDDTIRSRASASFITGSHNARLGFEGAYFAEKTRNEVNDLRLTYHYQTPATSGTPWNTATRTGNCYLAPPSDVYSCGNMTRDFGDIDPTNRTYLFTRPVAFSINTGVAELDERVWFGALYLQDQWTFGRFTLSGALRWDHAESRYGQTCIGPDVWVPVQADGTNRWCSSPAHGVTYNDITPRWGVAWDVFGNGKTSVKWNMGKYLQAAGFGGRYTGFNDARRSLNQLTRNWDDMNGDRIVQCDMRNHLAHQNLGDFCGALVAAGSTNPSTEFLQFGRPPNAAQLELFAAANGACGVKNLSAVQQAYCDDAGQNLMSGWGKRRGEWQLGLGVQHELLPRLSVEVTYNRKTYFNLTDSDVVNQGCDYYGAVAAEVDWRTCPDGWMGFNDPTWLGLRDFFTFPVPVDSRLPGGGGYMIRGLWDQKQAGQLPAGGGAVTVIRKDLKYSWNGVDTNVVLRARNGLRIWAGTTTGHDVRDTCYTDIDSPAVKGRVGNGYRGNPLSHPAALGGLEGCRPHRRLQTLVRANASYTIPRVDVLVGAVFQYRPGGARNALLTVSNADVVWEPASAARAGTVFNTPAPTSTRTVNLLDAGDLYGEGSRIWDLKVGKNIRFGRTRLNLGVDVFNLFNSDAAIAYENTYTAFRLPDGTWVEDNPATAGTVEANDWGRVTQIFTPRLLKLSIQLDF